jgi:hypothetical protein
MPGRRSRAATSTEAFASDSESLHRSAAEDLRRLVGHLPHRSRATSVSREDYSLKEPHEQDYREHRRYVVPCCPNLRIAAQQTPEWGSGVAPFAFALTGDMPYGPVRETPFARLVAEINRDNAVDFVMHAGDMLRQCSRSATRAARQPPSARARPSVRFVLVCPLRDQCLRGRARRRRGTDRGRAPGCDREQPGFDHRHDAHQPALAHARQDAQHQGSIMADEFVSVNDGILAAEFATRIA